MTSALYRLIPNAMRASRLRGVRSTCKEQQEQQQEQKSQGQQQNEQQQQDVLSGIMWEALAGATVAEKPGSATKPAAAAGYIEWNHGDKHWLQQ